MNGDQRVNADEFRTIAERIKAIYGILKTEDELDIWYELLGESDYKIMNEAVDNYILANQYSPKPADIWSEYKKIERHIRENKNQIRGDYLMALSHYPCAIDDASNRNAWSKAVTLLADNKSWEDRLKASDRLMHLVASFVKTVDKTSGTLIPKFADYLREVVNEYRS